MFVVLHCEPTGNVVRTCTYVVHQKGPLVAKINEFLMPRIRGEGAAARRFRGIIFEGRISLIGAPLTRSRFGPDLCRIDLASQTQNVRHFLVAYQ